MNRWFAAFPVSVVAYTVLETSSPPVNKHHRKSVYLLVRVYKKDLRTTSNLSARKETLEEVKQWLMEKIEKLLTSIPKEHRLTGP